MAYKIVASQCSACGACEFECPNAAIAMKGDMFVISAAKCTECEGEEPRCIGVCPVEKTIIKA
jgi:ferredoxin